MITSKSLEPDCNPLCLDIRREYILMDAMKEARKKRFTSRKLLKVNNLTAYNNNYVWIHVFIHNHYSVYIY